MGTQSRESFRIARGQILRTTQDDNAKIAKAHHVIRQRLKVGEGVFNFSGLERAYPEGTDDISRLDDEMAAATYNTQLVEAALQHLGGTATVHDIFLANRVTAATVATHLTMVKPGQTVIGVSPSYSHPTVIRATNLAGAKFVGTTGVGEFSSALRTEKNVSLVVLTRLAVTYDILDTRDLKRDHGANQGEECPGIHGRRGRGESWTSDVRAAPELGAGR